MNAPLVFAGLAALLLAVAAIDYFLLVPQGTVGPLTAWMLLMLGLVGSILGSVCLVLAAVLVARDRRRAGDTGAEEPIRRSK